MPGRPNRDARSVASPNGPSLVRLSISAVSPRRRLPRLRRLGVFAAPAAPGGLQVHEPIQEYYIYNADMTPYERTNDSKSYQINDSIDMVKFGIEMTLYKTTFVIKHPEQRCCEYEYIEGEEIVDFQLDVINTVTNESIDAIPYFFIDYAYSHEPTTLSEFLNGQVVSSFSIKLEPDTLIPLSALFEANITISDGEQYQLMTDTILFKKITDPTDL